MSIQRFSTIARRHLSPWVFDGMRRVGTAVLAPVLFSARTGHAISAFRRKAVDRNGKPIPWITYPAIDLLTAKDLSAARVLEFGAGHSTLWFAERAAEVVSLEDDAEWHQYISKQLRGSNADVHKVRRSLDDVESILGRSGAFDIVLVDGLDRLKAAELARHAVAERGVIVLDNSEGYWGPEGTYPILEMLRHAGFMRADFYGMAPGVVHPHCTSFFFRDRCFLFEGTESPRRYVGE